MINIPKHVKPGISLDSICNESVRRDVPAASRQAITSGTGRRSAGGSAIGSPAVGRQHAAGSNAGSPRAQSQSPANPQASRNSPNRNSPNRPTVTRPQAAGIPGHQGTGAILQKGQKTSLTALSPGLKLVDVCLGWDVAGQPQYDLDTECFLLGQDGRVVGDEWFVFYNQPVSPDGLVRHDGANKTGDGNGDDEILHINLAQLSPQVTRLVFILTINEAKQQRLNFSGIRNAYIRVVDKSANKELVRFLISEYYNSITSMVVGEIYKYKDEWKFTPIGEGTQDDLYGLCIRYGVEVAE